MGTVLRDYQERAIILLREHISHGLKKVIMALPTGAGKSVIFGQIIKNALDKNIGRLRNQRYASIKKAQGGKAPMNIADLKNKGSFYRGIKASANQTTFTLTSTDSKKDLLIKKYTNEIFGYSSKTFTLVKDEILVPGMITDIRKQLNI